MSELYSPFIAIALALAFLWQKNSNKTWIKILVTALILGLYFNTITFFGLVFIIAYGLACKQFYDSSLSKIYKVIVGVIIFIMSFAFFAHQIPGFNNIEIFNDKLSDDSIPYRMFLNFDKPLVGLFILGFGIPLIKKPRDLRVMLVKIWPLIILAAIILISLSYILGYVKFDPKLPHLFYVWFFSNLLFTCFAEEAFFRGFMQKNLAKAINPYAALVMVSIIFGACHYMGGWKFMILSAIAGLFYGYSYMKTQKIEASIAIHFIVNTTHFLLFSYPALEGSI